MVFLFRSVDAFSNIIHGIGDNIGVCYIGGNYINSFYEWNRIAPKILFIKRQWKFAHLPFDCFNGDGYIRKFAKWFLKICCADYFMHCSDCNGADK